MISPHSRQENQRGGVPGNYDYNTRKEGKQYIVVVVAAAVCNRHMHAEAVGDLRLAGAGLMIWKLSCMRKHQLVSQ